MKFGETCQTDGSKHVDACVTTASGHGAENGMKDNRMQLFNLAQCADISIV